jgi:spiro-SPASM protein
MSQAEALSDDIVVDLSLWGEPSLHPDFGAIAASVLARKRFTLLVETCGIGWKTGVAEAVAEAGGERVHWIVSLDDPDPASYLALRGEGMAEAVDFTRRMAERFPGQVHAQAVRMQGNEERLESFYRSWKKDIEKVIIQKYDAFSGTLPRLSVADLSPLERFPCRHLARDSGRTHRRLRAALQALPGCRRHAARRCPGFRPRLRGNTGKRLRGRRLSRGLVEGFILVRRARASAVSCLLRGLR